MKPKFDYDSVVKVRSDASLGSHLGEKAWVVGVFTDRTGAYFDKFPQGIVYTIEFEDGTSVEVHENDLELQST